MYEPLPSGVWRQILRHSLQLLFPMSCLNCDGLAPDGIGGLGLCLPCRGRVRVLRAPLCRRCCRPLDAAAHPPGFTCISCINAPPVFDGLAAVWSYESPIDSVIRALKFSGLAALSKPLGTELANRLPTGDDVFDLISPVPLHWSRRITRGFDQAEDIARAVAKRFDRKPTMILRRRRATRAQSCLPRADRAANLASAFALRKGAEVSGRRVLLVDDVVTSGATLAAAATCLKRAGALSVTGAVLARTPRPDERPVTYSS